MLFLIFAIRAACMLNAPSSSNTTVRQLKGSFPRILLQEDTRSKRGLTLLPDRFNLAKKFWYQLIRRLNVSQIRKICCLNRDSNPVL